MRLFLLYRQIIVMYHNRINEKSYINEVGYQMANKAKILARLIDEKGISRRAFAEKIIEPFYVAVFTGFEEGYCVVTV